MILELIKPLSLLLSLTLLQGAVFHYLPRNGDQAKIISGILYGSIAVFAIMVPFNFIPGVIIDSRSVIISLSGFFGGPLSAFPAALIAASYRYYTGGAGASAGSLVVILCALAGVAAHFFHKRYPFTLKMHHFYLFGLFSHIIGMFGMAVLPADIRWIVIKGLSLPFFVIYPFATVFLGTIIRSIYLYFEDEEKLRREIAALTKAEKKIEEEQEKLRRYEYIVSSSLDAMALIDKNFIYLAVNDAYCRLYGLPKESIIGSRTEDIVGSEAFHKAVRVHAEKCFQGENVYFENWIDTKTAGWRYLGVAYTPYFSPEGEIIGFSVVSRDSTERKRAEEELKESQTRFKDLAENSTDWIWELDENDNFSYSSPRVKDLLGYEPHEILGKSAFFSINQEEHPRIHRIFYSYKDHPKPFSNLVFISRHKKGHEVILEASGVPLFDTRGKIKGYRGINRDITQRMHYEEKLRQSQKIEAIGTLAGGIAHDFNNILSVILGYTSLALSKLPEKSSLTEDIEEIYNAGTRAKSLVKHILAFSRKESSQMEPAEITPVARGVLKFLRATIPSTIELREHIDEQAGTILADETQLHQVITNLCTNAAQAMEERGGIIDLTISNREVRHEMSNSFEDLKPGSYVILSIKDNGPGIPQDNLERIFDPYFTTKKVGKGSGLGLSVVMGIVKSHRATIQVESFPGAGTHFQIYFPRIEEKSERPGHVKNTAFSGIENILIVDDEESIARVTMSTLKKKGYHVHVEADSSKALAHFQQSPYAYDLLITDQTMPGMTGDQLAAEILQIRPGFPVIMCTGYSPSIDEKAALSRGIRKFIMKPVLEDELFNAVREVLDHK
jgi:PAS domain S-box-containing protein